MSRVRVLAPELLLEEGEFRQGRAVRIDAESGRIAAVGSVEEMLREREPSDRRERPGGSEPLSVERLDGRALLPGFVNTHSHAFQRLIRGRTQWKPAAEPEADFWSWRESMYAAARALSPEDVFAVARFCFIEMLRAGYTSVGEFHYLHRDSEGRPYADSNELARRTLAAAAAAGIRIALLDVCYAAGAIDEPLRPEQARFGTPDLDDFLHAVDALVNACGDDSRASVGIAPHSVRAVPRAWLRPLAEAAGERGLPLHMHLSEQPAEVADCRAAYGMGPVELAAEEGLLGPSFTGVHVTHPAGTEIRRFGEAGATACLCPTTERDLGDGIPPATELLEAGASFALGSDSHVVIDPFEEMRLVEYHERLRTLRRVVLAEPTPGGGHGGGRHVGGRVAVAPRLLGFATAGGARSLGLEAGVIRAGAAADLVAVDLEDRRLAGWTAETLPELLAFSGSADLVTDAWVGGVRRVEARRHPGEPEAAEAFRDVARRVG